MNSKHKPDMHYIPCETVTCFCPSARGDKDLCYSFRYIDNNKNFIYYDIPKCASTTIRNLLFPDAWKGSGDNPCRHSLLEPIIPNKKYFSFTFVRNPWSRMVSNWSHFCSKPLIRKKLEDSDVDMNCCRSFKDFVYMTLKFNNHHWQPQHLYIPKSGCDFIGKTENFNEDFNRVCEALQIPSQNLSRQNTSDHKHYTEYYDDETREIVAQKYAKDVDLFGYEFVD